MKKTTLFSFLLLIHSGISEEVCEYFFNGTDTCSPPEVLQSPALDDSLFGPIIQNVLDILPPPGEEYATKVAPCINQIFHFDEWYESYGYDLPEGFQAPESEEECDTLAESFCSSQGYETTESHEWYTFPNPDTDFCEIFCSSESGCDTCGELELDSDNGGPGCFDLWEVYDYTMENCQNAYNIGGGTHYSCRVEIGYDSEYWECWEAETCTPDSCFLEGTKILVAK